LTQAAAPFFVFYNFLLKTQQAAVELSYLENRSKKKKRSMKLMNDEARETLCTVPSN